MYAILISPDFPLPTLIKRTDLRYPEFICMGYSEIDFGWKWEMEKRIEELTAEICGAMGHQL